MKNFLKKNYKPIIVFICLILILEIVEDLFEKEIMMKDVIGYKIVSTLISEKTLPIAKFITNFGGAIWLLIFSTILFIFIKNKKIGICIYVNLFLSAGLNQVLKRIVQRPRPTEFRLIDESGYSFPSGHSMVSAAFYGLLIYIIYKKIKNKVLKNFLITLLVLLILCIGISRIYLGVHYTSDVLAGFLISISYLIVFTNSIKCYIIDEDITKEE